MRNNKKKKKKKVGRKFWERVEKKKDVGKNLGK
jgi:hypothetical protein